ncbi:MAG TPA: SDR family NAD(P)-dependent oxidoreductase [Acidimicrobiales bacterium]
MTDTRLLQGKVAIIAGAGEGIGRSCALCLARDGADVVVAARRPDPLTKLAAEVAEEHGTRTLAVPTDLSDLAQCRALVDRAADELGRVDIVVNVATMSGGNATVDELDLDTYRAAFELNVLGVLEVSRHAARHMRRVGGGAIVQVSSLAATVMQPRMAAYSSTKRAMMVASFTMAKELGRDNIRVNVVTPGYTTGAPLDAMFAAIAARTGADPAEVSRQAARAAALRRHVDPIDIAEAVAFLASPRARNITGVELKVDAGQVVG